MAENLTVARPYAQAVFDIAVEDKTLDKWQEMLFALSLSCKDKNILTAIKNSPNAESAGNILISLLQELIDDKCKNLIRVIGENQRFLVIPDIYDEFLRLRKEHDKILTVQFISARPYDRSEIKLLKDKLASKYGCVIDFQEIIDESLIGGAILKIGDEVIDASIKTGIQSLSSTLR